MTGYKFVICFLVALASLPGVSDRCLAKSSGLPDLSGRSRIDTGTPQYRLEQYLSKVKQIKAEDIESIFKKWPDLLTCSDSYAFLVRYGCGDIAAEKLRSHKTGLKPFYTFAEMTPEFQKQADQWIATFDDLTDRLFAKLVMYGRRDAEASKGRLGFTMEQRMQAVAKEFLTMRFDFQMIEFVLLDNLMYFDCVGGILSDRAVIFARSVNNDFFNSFMHSSFHDFNFRLAELYFVSPVSQGDPTLVLDHIEKTAEFCRNSTDIQLRYRAVDGLRRIISSLGRHWGRRPQPSAEYTEAMLKIYDTLYSVFLDFEPKVRSPLGLPYNVDTYFCLLLATGKVEQFDKNMAKLTKEDIRAMAAHDNFDSNIRGMHHHWKSWESFPVKDLLGNFSLLLQTEFYKKRAERVGLGDDMGLAYFFYKLSTHRRDWIMKDIESTLLLDQPLSLAFRDGVRLFHRGFYLTEARMPKFISFVEKSLESANTPAEKSLMLGELAFYCGRYKMPEVVNKNVNKYFSAENAVVAKRFDVSKYMDAEDVRRNRSGVELFEKTLRSASVMRAKACYFSRAAYVMGQDRYNRREQMDKIVRVFIDATEEDKNKES